MSTVHTLFGDTTSNALSSHALFLERATHETKRARRAAADLALGAYVIARLIEALLERDDTADSRDSFRWQRDMALSQINTLPKDAPETNHLAGIVEAIPIDGGPPPALAISLTAYAYFLEYEGRLEEALDILALSARTREGSLPLAELGAYALFAGKLHRLLAQWERALICYQVAVQVGESIGDHTLMLRGSLHQGAVARGQGNLPKARAVAEQVLHEAVERGLGQVQTMAYADLSAVYSLQGLPLEGIRAAYAAFLVAPTPSDRMAALGDLAIGLAEIGASDQARLALQIVADARTEFRLRANALIELMELESAAGNRLAFERHRTAADACRDRMPPSMLVDFRFKTGVGFARFGVFDRARTMLTLARESAEAHALNAWYFRIEQTLDNLAIPDALMPKEPDAPELRQSPVIHEVELGLREFSAATSA